MENGKVPLEGVDPGPNWRDVLCFNSIKHPELPLFNLSLACNHCVRPACWENCPAMAYRKDDVTGAVEHIEEHCIGCTYCTWACPYDSPKYNPRKGVVEKCNFCRSRLEKGLEPACVDACPVDALRIEERSGENGADGNRIPGFPSSDLEPGIEFVKLRGDGHIPHMTAKPDKGVVDGVFESTDLRPPKKITLRGEWALLLFTTVATLLTAWFFAYSRQAVELHPLLFGTLGAIAMGVTFVHLGRKWRAFRAVFHVWRSWLSREILLFSLFLGFGLASLVFFPQQRLLAGLVNGLGLLSLISIDLIYRVTISEDRLDFHSARTVLGSCYLAGILAGMPVLAIGFGIVKLLLYGNRKRRLSWVSIIRVALGLVAPPAMILWLAPDSWLRPWGAAILAILGELIDRMEFYREMDVETPRRQIVEDMNFLLRNRSPQAIIKDHRTKGQ
jgi:Fe-S-cluster-containing hydrogenase component 2/DMSO reductase anchor subunit